MNEWCRPLLTLLLCSGTVESTAAYDPRQQLTAPDLLRDTALAGPVSMRAFTPAHNAGAASHRFEGVLEISGIDEDDFKVLRDDYGYTQGDAGVHQLPPFRFSFVQAGEQLIPATRGVVASSHPHWEWLLEPGRVWQEPGDETYSRAALPFSLVQRGENCTHNGVMSFLYKEDGSISRISFEIASETCLYFKFDWWGLASARYLPGVVTNAATLIQANQTWVANRLPIKPLENLAREHPAARASNFSGAGVIDAAHMTVYGFVIDGVNYVGGCTTRQGPYPFCEVLDLPSYSLAKSLLAGLGLMRMEKLYPGVAGLAITDHVPACAASGNWQGTSLENTLDMATGNFGSPTYDDDETAAIKATEFFDPTRHADKIAFACGFYPRRIPPGKQWVYHTSDTYVLGTAMNAYLAQQLSPERDLLDDILLPWWEPLTLSPTARVSRRTYDEEAQLFTGYGLTLHVDDIAKLATFANGQKIRREVSPAMLDAAMQRNPLDPGLAAIDDKYYYNNGFWAYRGYTSENCRAPINLPFMLGYGGINVILMPNDTVYYYFSDGGSFGWLTAARESDHIRPFCSPPKGSAT